jgi:hypothetical protein
VLHRLRGEALTDLVQPSLTLFALALRSDLDQLVTAQTNVDLLQHGLRKAFVADQHHRVERMRLRTECPALLGRQCCALGIFHLRSIV